ncbi:MAG: type II toxin-antitoxin system VapC family toxin [Caldilineaceae bacterium]|nr:type II toxin-antitoxin system VapC family toxin [Caldilineaceae bacterium]HRJ42879.1 type II toxin-antitoxin system VapC family toxin [Caldilineaceae bacterium]
MSDYVADTHSLIWYLTSDARLGNEARKIFAAGGQGTSLIFVPTISLVEIVYLQEKHKSPATIFAQFQQAMNAQSAGLRLFALTREVVTALSRIPRQSIPDMPDRIIAATALHLNVPLISRDRRIQLSTITSVW